MDIWRNQDFGLSVRCLWVAHSSGASSPGFLRELRLPSFCVCALGSPRAGSPDQSCHPHSHYLVVNAQLHKRCVTLECFNDSQDPRPRNEVWLHIQALQCVIDLQHFCQGLWTEVGRKSWQSDRQGQSTTGQQGFSPPHLQSTPRGFHMLCSFTATRWSALCGVNGVPCCCRGILEHEHAGGHSKTSHGQTLGATPKGDSPHLQLPCDSFICPSSKASIVWQGYWPAVALPPFWWVSACTAQGWDACH